VIIMFPNILLTYNSDTSSVARSRRFLPQGLTIHLSHRHSENLVLRLQVMDAMPILIEVPLAGVHPTAPDNRVHAEILTRCFVSRYVMLIYVVRC